jgi:hypothetical protein
MKEKMLCATWEVFTNGRWIADGTSENCFRNRADFDRCNGMLVARGLMRNVKLFHDPKRDKRCADYARQLEKNPALSA